MRSKAERTKLNIIQCAAPIFNQKGFSGTSIMDIAAAIDSTKGSIYGNFNSKEDLAVVSFDYAVDQVFAAIDHYLRQETTALGKLQAAVNFYRDYLRVLPVAGGCPILNTAIDTDDTNPTLRKKVINAVERLSDYLSQLVEAGISQGQIRPEVDVEAFVTYFIVMVEGGIMLAKTLGDESKLHFVADMLLAKIDADLVL